MPSTHSLTKVTTLSEDDVLKITLDPANAAVAETDRGITAGALTGGAKTQAEIDAGVTIVNMLKPPGNVLRYRTNTTPGTTDMTAAFQAAVDVGLPAYAPAGTYKINTAITTTDADMIIYGDGDDTVLDFTGTITGDYALEPSGSLTQIQELGSNGTVGDKTLTFASAPSLSVGDVFVIYNPTDSSWSGFRAVYRAGEWCEVESISGSVVTLKIPLYDSYVVANVDVYKLTSPKVSLKNFKITGTTIEGLIKPTLCSNVKIENITAEHANNSIMYLDRCYNSDVINPVTRNVGDGGDDYGIIISNSQHVRVNGGSSYARRHAIDTGGNDVVGSVTCRDVRVRNMTLSNDTDSGVSAASYHGNTEDCSYENCTIYGSATLEGKNNYYRDCIITSASGGYCMYHGEVLGGTLGVIDCTFTTYVRAGASSRGVYDIGGNSTAVTSNTAEDVTFMVHGCRFFMRNMNALDPVVEFANNGATVATNFDIQNVHIDSDATVQVLRTTETSGTADADFIIVDNIFAPSGSYLHLSAASAYNGFPHRMMRQSGTESVTTDTGASYVAASATTFRYIYPYTPVILTAHSSRAYMDNRIGVVFVDAVAATGITLSIGTDDATNFSAALATVLNWSAEIRDI